MGLSGRKVKQRIGADPRNLTWADDAARFGQNYLSKFGWDASKGLGAGEDGMKSHIKVSHKLDMLGIGAAQTKDPNGIAWKQNRDFENLLERLNKNLAAEQANTENEAKNEDEEEENGDKRKRKHKETSGEDNTERKKKKSKKAKDADEVEKSVSVAVESMQIEEVIEVKRTVALPRHRAHRARAIAAKNIASKSAARISEILGVAPTPAASSSFDLVSQGKLTSVTETDALGMDKLTTSTKSLADYFKDKLNARSGSRSAVSTPSSSTPSRAEEADHFDVPRGGIGASRMHLEIQTETNIEEETQRVGLSKFSSLMSSSFISATSSFSSYVPAQEAAVIEEASARISEVASEAETKDKEKKKEKKSRKDKKGKSKAESKEDADTVAEKKRRKKEKKVELEAAVERDENDNQVDEKDNEKASRKKEKRKHKSEKTDSTPIDAESRKEKKKLRKSSTTDS